MEIRLEYERERRERLEAELDQLRKQLQHTAAELQHCQSLLRHHNKVCGRANSSVMNSLTCTCSQFLSQPYSKRVQ